MIHIDSVLVHVSKIFFSYDATSDRRTKFFYIKTLKNISSKHHERKSFEWSDNDVYESIATFLCNWWKKMKVILEKIWMVYFLCHSLLSLYSKFPNYPKHVGKNSQLQPLRYIKRPDDSTKKIRISDETASITYHSTQLDETDLVVCGKWSFLFISVHRKKTCFRDYSFIICRFSVLGNIFSYETSSNRLELMTVVI